MLIIASVKDLTELRQSKRLHPELLDYMEPTLRILEEEYPERNPSLEGGRFIVHQCFDDLFNPVHGLFYTIPGESYRLPIAEQVEQIVTEAGQYSAVFVAVDDDTGDTHLLPHLPWVPGYVLDWLRKYTDIQ